MKLMNSHLFSFLFFLVTAFFLAFGFNNCGSSNDETVVTRSRHFSRQCNNYVNQKVGVAGPDSSDETSPLLTPVDGNWEDPSRDPRRSDQTYLDVLAADQAHQIVYEGVSPSQEPVIVAVIDTGIDYNHPDLVHQIYRKSDGTIVGYDFYNNDGDPIYERDSDGEPLSHGTHVAGLVAAEGHNDQGIRGGAPEFVKIMPIKIFGPGGARNIDQAIRYAADQGADVINMSFGSRNPLNRILYPDLDEHFAQRRAAIQHAVDQGAVCVIASGNNNIELNDMWTVYPAKFGSEMNGVITVGAFDTIEKTVSPFSNFSPVYVEVQAPGSRNRKGILSTLPENTYGYMPGTSMATPLVAGLVALAKVYLKKKGIRLTPSQIEDLLKETSLKYRSLANLAQEGRVINYKNMADRLVKIYESGIVEHPIDLRLVWNQEEERYRAGRLAIKVKDYSVVQKYQWYHNGEAINGANEIEFMIREPTAEDEGEYYVEVTLQSGEVVNSLKGTVELVDEVPCE